MKSSFRILLLVSIALLIPLLVGSLAGCSGKGEETIASSDKGSPEKEGGEDPVGKNPEASGLEALFVRLSAEAGDEPLTDLSPFQKTAYGAVGDDFVIRFSATGGEAKLDFAGKADKSYSGTFSATGSRLTVGGTSFRYAFFNSYLLLQSDFGMHILYPAAKLDSSAALALMRAGEGKTAGTSLSFDQGKVSLTLPGFSVKEGSYLLDRDSLTVLDTSRVNLALGKKLTVSSTESAANGPDNLCDGNTATRWSSSYNDNQWVTVDLGEVRSVSVLRLRWEVAAAKDFTIEVSTDGKSFETVYTEKDNSLADAWGTYSFDPVEARYVKLSCGRRLTQYGVSLYELEVYESYQEPGVFSYSLEGNELLLSDGENSYRFAVK